MKEPKSIEEQAKNPTEDEIEDGETMQQGLPTHNVVYRIDAPCAMRCTLRDLSEHILLDIQSHAQSPEETIRLFDHNVFRLLNDLNTFTNKPKQPLNPAIG